MIQNYEDLEVYRKSYAQALRTYEAVKLLPKEETYGLTNQMKRAALSIPLNIAEGYGKRESAAEFKRFLAMAKGSCDEMKVIADFCKDLGFMTCEKHKELKASYDEIGRMLHGMIQKWQ